MVDTHDAARGSRSENEALADKPPVAPAPQEVPKPPVESKSPDARKRVLIIGLDGATFDSLNPLMVEGRLPRLAQATGSGASGILYSTVPPITPAAWTTFLTGKQPGTHRILDFEGYDVSTGHLQLLSSRRASHVRNLWHILGEKGFKVGSVNVPMTYPPSPINGFMVTGFETPGSKSDFAYPPELKPLILERWPDPTLKAKWRRKIGGGDAQFARNLNYISNSFQQGADMTMWLGERYGWDVLMVVFKLIDNLQHKTWKYIDPKWSERHPARRDMVKQCFADMDRAVGRLLDYAESHAATVLIVSDHGHGSLEGEVYPNRFLEEWGHLALRDRSWRVVARARKILDRWRDKRKLTVKTSHDIERHVPVDLSRTRACVMHAGAAGFLYVNLKGRQPTGIVETADYESLRNELAERFLGAECRVRDPSGKGIQLFEAVYKPEELYGRQRKDEPWMPDLILIQHGSLQVVRRTRGRKRVKWFGYRRLEGTHRKEGILIATGPGVAKRNGLSGRLVDCAPTILALLGQRIPSDMEGHVLTDLFERPPTVLSEPVAKPSAQVHGVEIVHSEEDERKVTERLMNLGYLS